jgi:RNA polymerase sigma factor (sigma-70 family)
MLYKESTDEFIRTLHNSYFGRMVKLARKLLILKDNAEDITQDVFTLALQRGDELKNYENPQQWLYGALFTLCKEANRKTPETVSLADEKNEYISEKLAECEDMTEKISEISDSQAEKIYDKIFLSLDGREEELYKLHFAEHKREQEIAEKLNISYDNCRKQISRLKSKILKLMKVFIEEVKKEKEKLRR